MRPAPVGYIWLKSVDESISAIETIEYNCRKLGSECIIKLIDTDHDAGDFVGAGGDYIKLLNWLEETGRNYPIRIHSMNPVGVANMRAIIERNGWTEVR